MNENIESIEWPESMLTGISRIDEQHQMLASMINQAQNRLTKHSSRTEIEAIIRDLMTYALFHFDTEEELMLAHNYDPIEKDIHCNEHRSFSAAIAEFQHNIRLGKLVSRDELLGFVKNWLTSHIMSTDKKLGAFLSTLPKTDL